MFGKQMLVTSLATTVWLAGCETVDPVMVEGSNERIGDDTGLVAMVESGGTPVTDITIDLEGCDYLQIDTFLEPTSDRDANLCSQFSDPTFANYIGHVPTACAGLTFGAAFDADNPNEPGPGTAGAYCDWAELDWATHFAPFSDAANSTEDDSFQGACLVPGHKATPKADIGNVGLAASTDGDYLYIGWERFAVNGNERGSLILTRELIEQGILGSCTDPQPLTDLVEGSAYRIDLKVDSTAALPFAEIQVFEYVGTTVVNQTMQQVLVSPNWVAVTDAGAIIKALNVNGTDKNAVAGEDTEKGIDGNTLSTAQWIEVAVDTELVFGQGCGLDFNGHFTTTASEGQNDALKDYSGPFHFSTGALTASVDLYESCTPGTFDYDVSASLGELDVDFSTDPIDVDLVIDCDGTAFDDTITDPVLPSGTITVGSPTVDLDCSVTAELAGSGSYDACDAEPSANVAVYPPLTASGALTQDCDGTFDYDGTLTSSSDAGATFEWTFTVGGTEQTPVEQEDGTFTLDAATVTPATITAALKVTDGTTRAGETETLTCTTNPTVTGVTVYRPLSLVLTPGADATCTDGEAALDAVGVGVAVSGGSGSYDLDYGVTGDAVANTCLDETGNGGSDSCSFSLGTGACADGTLTLTVADALTGSGCPNTSDTLRAVRESTLDVEPLVE